MKTFTVTQKLIKTTVFCFKSFRAVQGSLEAQSFYVCKNKMAGPQHLRSLASHGRTHDFFCMGVGKGMYIE